MFVRTFGPAFAVTVAGLGLALCYGGAAGIGGAAVLAVLEISLSFDNAVVNATVLGRMSEKWQRLFLTVGVLIAVVGMRLLVPLLVVCLTAGMSPVQAYNLAMRGGDPTTPNSYGWVLHQAHPAIAAFGGVFLLTLFLNYIFEEREITWLSWIERPLAKLGRLRQLSVIVAAGALVFTASVLALGHDPGNVMVAGALGLITYLLVKGLGDLFEPDSSASRLTTATGRAALLVFLYLEVVDATFSFDGVIGAFAITSDPVLIAIGLGIGAMYIRSLTVFLVRRGTLHEYAYLEHGAQWAVGALAVLLLCTIRYDVPELVTALVGIGFIGTALLSSVIRNRNTRTDAVGQDELLAPRAAG
jgi:hypothetical protein